MRCFGRTEVHPVVYAPEFEDLEFLIARDLSMTRAQLRRTMGNHEYVEWIAFRIREGKAREEAMKEARKGRKK